MGGLKLNLGCGMRKLEGYINVDKYGDPDVRHDLELFPWPWQDDSADEMALTHVLEHLGQDPDTYIGIIKEIYRVCRPGASVKIVVPHHRHDYFFDDPTHVRAVTPFGLRLFSQRENREWIAQNAANSPLGLYHGVDFELVQTNYKPSPFWYQLHPNEVPTLDKLLLEGSLYNNLIEEIHMTLDVIKPAGGLAAVERQTA
jgi:hypothetical protein